MRLCTAIRCFVIVSPSRTLVLGLECYSLSKRSALFLSLTCDGVKLNCTLCYCLQMVLNCTLCLLCLFIVRSNNTMSYFTPGVPSLCVTSDWLTGGRKLVGWQWLPAINMLSLYIISLLTLIVLLECCHDIISPLLFHWCDRDKIWHLVVTLKLRLG